MDEKELRSNVSKLLTYLLATVDACEVHENLMGIDPPIDEEGREWWDDNVMDGGQKIIAIDYHALTLLKDVATEWRYQEDKT